MPAKVIDIGEWKAKNMPQQQTVQPTPFTQDMLQGNDMSALVKSLFGTKKEGDTAG